MVILDMMPTLFKAFTSQALPGPLYLLGIVILIKAPLNQHPCTLSILARSDGRPIKAA